ncbi:MAG: SRPBCC family protein [Chitinophagaceae bacterium]
MNTFHFSTSQFLPVDISKAWSFFSSPRNLPLITPPELNFKILTEGKNEEIFEGMLIDYKVTPLFGIPLNWQTRIEKMKNLKYFIDKQIKGPYKLWEHKHYFTEYRNGVLMKDEVKYQLPFGVAGRIAHSLLVRKKIEKIFEYRKMILEKIFDTSENLA